MPRQIKSHDPVVVPAVAAKNLQDMTMTKFVVRRQNGIFVAEITMSASDHSTGEIDETQNYRFKLNNFEQQIAQSEKMQRAWDDVNDIMGLAYDFFRLKEKVTEKQDNGEDASAEIAARDKALADLREPLVPVPPAP